MNNYEKEIVIIGAGLTGLTLAYYLKKAGKNFILLTDQNRVGGVINTISEDGFIYETGPNTGVLATAEAVELFENLKDKCELETANPKSNKRYIWKNNKWNPLPMGLISAVTTPLFSFTDKLRILTEPFRKKGLNPDESIADLVRRRMGKSYLEYAVDPFISGIYAGDPEQLITKFALPKLYNLEQNYGSFIRGAFKKKKEPKSEFEKKATREVFSASGGLSNLVKALESEIGAVNIVTEAKDIIVNYENSIYTINYPNSQNENKSIQTKKLIATVNPNSLNKILTFIDEKEFEPIKSMNYAKVVQVAVGYQKWNGFNLDGFGGLIPSKEKRNILGVLFISSILSNRAPEKGALISIFLGGIKNTAIYDKSDDEIKNIVLDEIKITLQTNDTPDLIKIFRYPLAIPQYDNKSKKKIEAINVIESKYKGLYLAGNIRDGIGMADRVKQAKDLYNIIINEL